jgi:hypothetical protein
MTTAPRQGWHERYLGLKYRSGEFDCLDFVVRVQREVFGRHVDIPPPVLPPAVAADDYQEGDIALFTDSNNLPHIGILMFSKNRCYLIHNNRAKRGVSVERFPTRISPTLRLVNVYRVPA